MNSARFALTLASVLGLIGTVSAADAPSATALRSAMLLHTSFDGRLDADFAVGDPKLYHAPTGNRSQAKPGLPDDGLVVLASGAGRQNVSTARGQRA